MPWCPHCSDDHPTASSAAQLVMIPSSPDPDGSRGRRFTSCSACGRVLKDRPLASLPQLHQKALSAIATCALNLNLNLNLTDDNAAIIISDAHRLFRTALDKEELFARSRHTRNNAASACLYLALRRHRKPYMLIHLSDYLSVTVYVLGGTLLALSTILKLTADAEEELSLYPNSSSFIDPSLFMHRISSRLLGRKDTEVAATALRILSGTKKPREWMLSKQKQIPIRYCTAALYIAAIARQEEDEVKFSQSEVAAAVCAEFESTEQLSIEEFVSRAAAIGSNLPSNEELVCEHRKSDRAHCCYGLCRECYDVFSDISSQGGCMMISEQPAFQQNDRKRQKIIKCKKKSVSTLSDVDEDDDISVYLNTEREKQYKTMIWELMHKEYLEEQAAKNAAAAAAAAGTSIDGVKPRKERRKQTRAGDRGSNSNTAAAAAAKDKMKKNQLSSRINYDVLSQMYADEKQLTTETNIGAVTEEQDNKKNKEFEIEAMEDYKEAEVYEENNSTEAEQNDYVGDEGYGEGGEYNEYYADGNEDYADDDFGF